MAYYRRRRRGYNRYRGGGMRRRYARRYSGQFRAAAQQRDQARVVLKSEHTATITIDPVTYKGFFLYNLWTGLANTPFYDLYAKMFDQLKINCIRVKISMKGLASGAAYPGTGVYTYIAFDRNGIAQPQGGMTYEKIATYSSAKAKMLNPGSTVNQYLSVYPTTIAEQSQFVATSAIPNIAAGLADDGNDETSAFNYMQWPFKPILLFGVESNTGDSLVFRVSLQYDVTFRGMRYEPDAIE